jgi:hypothetical protein
MSEKQTPFITINCAENLESPNQCIGWGNGRKTDEMNAQNLFGACLEI